MVKPEEREEAHSSNYQLTVYDQISAAANLEKVEVELQLAALMMSPRETPTILALRCVHTYPDPIWIGTMWIQS